ncbi:isoaspartyl peptidase/L-asparaginase [Rhodopirellula sp. JC740]|uniref:Isoaspartyl peptidase/L-asparaginase n=1 Tax=Rhodopirellula halodulae TaxID=2894198 RepID=A0ABS8NKT1_9BACT|nr:isoaspartyl peptidase/L-asparaginase [Rhodopirellula sp. JC740]MCC9644172.1 isoaspartyl peptidase/L-asparaginase [Rhodopirellula sp. JC740]
MKIRVLYFLLAVAPAFQAPLLRGEETNMQPTWAIAIHGGAGSSPEQLGEESSRLRSAGLTKALQAGRDQLAQGATAIDTVESVIRILEDDPVFNAGRGAVLTEDGKAELDASIMDGNTLGCGAVAGVTKTKNPISLARLVMTQTKHVLLVGPGADEFSEDQQVPQVDPSYFLTDQSHNRVADLVSHAAPLRNLSQEDEAHLGTVGCVVLDSHGNLAAGTSTGGTTNKLPGRVGDSPIVGAGTYAANGLCAVSGTGVGEEYIRNAVAYDIAAQMKYADRNLESAVTDVMFQKLDSEIGGVIAVSQTGEIVLQHNTPGMSCGAADSTGRFEIHLQLENGGAPNEQDATESAQHLDEAEIQTLLQQQANDWNAGDIESFMTVYWKSDQLTFSSSGDITRGYEATLKRYQSRYPTAEAMGTLTFEDFEFFRLGEDAMQVLGVWKLERQEPLGGRFTLVLRRLPEGWRIVHDHTSSFPDPEKQ